MPAQNGLIKSVSRADFFMEEFATSKFTEDGNGYLNGQAVITNIGVFPYFVEDENGNRVVRWEARMEEDVFSPEHKKSLQMIPLTNDHPDQAVTPETAKLLQVGFIGDGIIETFLHLTGPISITDKKAIEDVKNGKRALSEGYKVDIEMVEGVYLGTPYQARQRNLRANHVAIVDTARAGDDAVIKMDKKDGYRFDGISTIDLRRLNLGNINSNTNINKEDNNMPNLKVIKIDGVDREAEAEVIIAHKKETDRADGLQTEKDQLVKDGQELQAKHDALDVENKKLKEDAEKAKKESPVQIDEAVTEKLGLITTATKFDVETKAEMTSDDIKKAVIIKAYPGDDMQKKLDENDSTYIGTSYDLAVKHLESLTEDGAANANAAEAAGVTTQDDPTTPQTAEQKHDAYVKSLKDAHKRDKK